ncbi:MAG: AMP-binding protein, partial [Halioglobus sp.]|nr:AMP-binding protein [Halioglobus sp.]
QWNANDAIKLIEAYGATVCVSATPFLKELVDTCQQQGKTLPGFRLFACGGASVPSALIYSAWDTLKDCRAVRVYGSTEVPLVTVGFLDAEERTLAAETDGRVTNYDVIIVDEHGNDVGLDTDGEILARGPAMMLGYSDDQQNLDAFSPSGYFRTGDIGRLSASGALIISDRKKDIIIRGGENIAAREIEEILLRSEAILEIAVVAVPHERLGEGIGACIVAEAGYRVDMKYLQELLADSGLAKQKWPQHLELLTALPKTASGKVQKDKLRQGLREQGVTL